MQNNQQVNNVDTRNRFMIVIKPVFDKAKQTGNLTIGLVNFL